MVRQICPKYPKQAAKQTSEGLGSQFVHKEVFTGLFDSIKHKFTLDLLYHDPFKQPEYQSSSLVI